MGKSTAGYWFEEEKDRKAKKESKNSNTDTEDQRCDGTEVSLKRKVTMILREIGVPVNIKGYGYLREAIAYCVNHHGKNVRIMEVYETIAKAHDDTVSRVERATRHAIERAWERGDRDALYKMFGSTIDSKKCKSTFGEFVMLLADELALREEEKTWKM